MKATSGGLLSFLASRPLSYIRTELFTITLAGGAIYRWTGGQAALTPIVNTFALGPLIQSMGFKVSRGVSTDTLSVKIVDDGSTKIGAVPLLTFMRLGGLTGATVMLERCYGTGWDAPASYGKYLAFLGRFAEITSWSQTEATIAVNSPMELLTDNPVTPNVYESSCRHVFCDAGCTLNAASLTVGGHTIAGTLETLLFSTNLVAAADEYTLGRITFTTGPNSGIVRTVKQYDGSGNISLILALPSTPTVGNNFQILPGCDLTMARCTHFSNLSHYGGFPFVPEPETLI